jgi:hypothetical protein
MLTKLFYIINLNTLLQVGILTFYRASVSSPFNRSPWPTSLLITPGLRTIQFLFLLILMYRLYQVHPVSRLTQLIFFPHRCSLCEVLDGYSSKRVAVLVTAIRGRQGLFCTWCIIVGSRPGWATGSREHHSEMGICIERFFCPAPGFKFRPRAWNAGTITVTLMWFLSSRGGWNPDFSWRT